MYLDNTLSPTTLTAYLAYNTVLVISYCYQWFLPAPILNALIEANGPKRGQDVIFNNIWPAMKMNRLRLRLIFKNIRTESKSLSLQDYYPAAAIKMMI